jgi:hypothetical protein
MFVHRATQQYVGGKAWHKKVVPVGTGPQYNLCTPGPAPTPTHTLQGPLDENTDLKSCLRNAPR